MPTTLTPDAFFCDRCRRPMKAPTADGLGPTCRRRIHGPSQRASRAAPPPTDELTMPIPFEGEPMTKPILFYRDDAQAIYQAAYRDGVWVDLEPDVFWALCSGREVTQ